MPTALLMLLASPALATTLEVSGTCPGMVTARVEGSARAPIALLRADGIGSTTVPAGACLGAPTGLDAPGLVNLRTSSGRGVATFQIQTTAADCDLTLGAIDLRTCDAATPTLQGPAPDYRQPGPWSVGSVVLPVTGRSGVSLPSELWFPAAAPGATPRVYRTNGYADGNGTAFTDAIPACDHPRPVLVHSHGNLSLPFEMFEVMEHIASHGWIVLAPEHTGNSWHAQGGWFLDMPYRRPRDVADAFSALADAATTPGHPLFGCVDPDAGFTVSGNSFGGYTSYATGGALVNDPFFPTIDLSDPRVNAIVNYVPWSVVGLLGSGVDAISVPVLTFGGERDATVGEDFRTLFNDLTTEPRVQYAFPDGGHLSFTPLWCDAPGNGCGAAFVNTDIAVAVAQTATMAFLEANRLRSGAVAQLPTNGPFTRREVGLP